LLSGGHYTTLNNPSALTQLTKATGINASGQIVGIYNPLLGQRGFSYNGTYSTIDAKLLGAMFLNHRECF
jgi:hypothetical protein